MNILCVSPVCGYAMQYRCVVGNRDWIGCRPGWRTRKRQVPPIFIECKKRPTNRKWYNNSLRRSLVLLCVVENVPLELWKYLPQSTRGRKIIPSHHIIHRAHCIDSWIVRMKVNTRNQSILLFIYTFVRVSPGRVSGIRMCSPLRTDSPIFPSVSIIH